MITPCSYALFTVKVSLNALNFLLPLQGGLVMIGRGKYRNDP